MKNRKVRSSVITIIIVLLLLFASAFGFIELTDDMVDHVITKSNSVVEDALEVKNQISKNIIKDNDEIIDNNDEIIGNNKESKNITEDNKESININENQ